MAHVWAARAVVPEMVERGEGYFLVTASAAGLLNIVESAPYGVTKHAAVAIAEWLRIAYGRKGVRVSCLCPQSVQTDMTRDGTGSAGINGVLTPEQVADVVLQTMREEKFLALPHPEVAKYFQAKGQDYTTAGWVACRSCTPSTPRARPRSGGSIGCCGCSPGEVLRDWESPNPQSTLDEHPDEHP